MAKYTVKRGNKLILEVECLDAEGELLQNLNIATAIRCDVKKAKTGAFTISKTLAAGDIVVDTPSTGWLTITFTPTDMTQDVQAYFIGIQITWGVDDIYELDLYYETTEIDQLEIEQDVVNT